MKYLVLLIGLFFSINSSAQNKACTGQEYTTNDKFFRATSNGSSMDITASKKKALSNARNSVISQITSNVEGAIRNQNCEEMYKKKMIELSLIAIRQEAGKIKTICESSSQVSQKYESSAVVEISKDDIKKSIITQITGDNTLKNRFDIERFRNSLK